MLTAAALSETIPVIETERLSICRAGIYHPENWPEPEPGWMICDPADQGRGLAREAAEAARNGARLHFGIDRPMSSIEAGDLRSIKLARRLGAIPDGEWQTSCGPMLRFRHGGTA